jgi:hypothetical protein
MNLVPASNFQENAKDAGEKLKAAEPALVILVIFSGALPRFDIVTFGNRNSYITNMFL